MRGLLVLLSIWKLKVSLSVILDKIASFLVYFIFFSHLESPLCVISQQCHRGFKPGAKRLFAVNSTWLKPL